MKVVTENNIEKLKANLLLVEAQAATLRLDLRVGNYFGSDQNAKIGSIYQALEDIKNSQ